MREMFASHEEILKKLEEIERKDIEQDDKIMMILEYIKRLEKTRQDEMEFKDRPRIGYKKWSPEKFARGFRLREGRPREAF